MFRRVLYVTFCFFVVGGGGEDALVESSVRRQQFANPQEPVRNGFEPLYSFGDYFFARRTDVSTRSTILPYTKNSTILLTNLFSLVVGLLLGAILTLCFGRAASRRPSVSIGTNTQQEVNNEDEKSQKEKNDDDSCQKKKEDDTMDSNNVDDKLDDDDDEFLEESLSLEAWTLGEGPFVRETKKGVLPHKKETTACTTATTSTAGNDPTQDLCRSIQDLTLTLKTATRPMNAILNATENIAEEVGTITRLTGWMAGRKSKKDAWIVAMDNLSFGVVVMNLCLAFSSALFGRWQDWGLGCESIFIDYDTKFILSRMWCYMKEPYVFVLGCVLWYSCTKCISVSGFFRKREALPTLLLLITLVLCGLLHSTVITLLGGSWHIAIVTWMLYSGFLMQVLDSAKECPIAMKRSKHRTAHSFLKYLFLSDTFTTVITVFLFPMMVSFLPFWNKGLALRLYYSSNFYVQAISTGIQQLYTKLCEFVAKFITESYRGGLLLLLHMQKMNAR